MAQANLLYLRKTEQALSLSSHSRLRYFTFIVLYFAQGLPEGMLFFGIPAWMAMNGKTPGEIAAFAVMCGLPWSFKFIVAPLMDRYTYVPMGRKRPWVLLGQLGLIVTAVAMALIPDPLNNLQLFMAAGFMVSFFGAFQDVATDGMAIDIIPFREQAKANGLMWGSKIIGIASSLALGSWLLKAYGFATSIAMIAVLIGIIFLVPLFLRERNGEKILPWSAGAAATEAKAVQLGSWSIIFRSLFSAFALRNSLLLATILFLLQGAHNYIATLLPIFTVKALGWTNVAYSNYYSSATLVGGMLGMLVGGRLIDIYGNKAMMNWYFFFLIFFTSVLAFNSAYWSNNRFILAYMVIYNVFYTFSCIGIFSIAMQCCWKKVSASQFTLYMTIANLGRIALAALIGPLKANYSWEICLAAFGIMCPAAWALFQFLDMGKQLAHIGELDQKN